VKSTPKHPRGADDVVLGGAKAGRLGRVHDRVLDALATIDDGQPADRAIAAVFRRARDLGRSERAQVADEVYAIARARRRLDDRLKRGLRSCGKRIESYDTRIRHRMLVLCLLLEQGASKADLIARDDYAQRRVKGLFEKIAKLKPTKKLGVECSIPDWLADALVAAGGEEHAIAVAAALAERAPLTVRVDHRHISRDTAAEALSDELGVEVVSTSLAPHGLILPPGVHVEGTELYADGWLEVMDEGSQLAAMATGAEPGHNVLDACAGAGGKTLALASLMNGLGRIAAVDVSGKKLEELRRRLRRTDFTNVEIMERDLIDLPKQLLGWADRVLVDAPCTGSGVFRRQPDARWRTTAEELLSYPAKQASLLIRAVDAAKPGAFVTYVTCSMLEAENEAVVERVRREQPKLVPAPLSETLGAELAERLGATTSMRIGPGPTSSDPDGFFIALFRCVE